MGPRYRAQEREDASEDGTTALNLRCHLNSIPESLFPVFVMSIRAPHLSLVRSLGSGVFGFSSSLWDLSTVRL